MTVIHIDKKNFKKEILDYKGIILVDFFADWCGPCRITGPIIDELAGEKKEVKFVKINVDKNPELASQYQVFSIPTFFIIKEGKILSQFVGAQSKETFLQEINKATGE